MPLRIADVVGLSPLQSGLYFHAVSGDADVYRYQLQLEIDGPLDVRLLRRCADQLIDRHTALRTAFVDDEDSAGEPVGVVLDGVRMPWRTVDLASDADADVDAGPDDAGAADARPADAGAAPAGADADAGADAGRQRRLAALAARELARPFPLDEAPLVRLLLARLAPERFVLVLTNHHIVLDGWSVPVLLRELFTLYARQADPHALAPARPFQDYLAWLAARDADDPVRPWRAALAGLSGPTLLAPGAVLTGRPERHPVPIDEALVTRLAEFSRARGVTVNTVLQVLWCLTLGAETGRSDVLFGATVTGRPPELPGVADMIGLFVNTVPVRVRTDPAESLAELVERVQREQAQLLDAHHVGLATLHRQTGFAPLFDTLMVFESYPGGDPASALAGTGLRVRPRPSVDATHYPLVLVVVPGRPMRVLLKYQPDVLPAARVARIGQRLLALAERLVDQPDRALAGLSPLTEAERTALAGWHGEQSAVTGDSLADLVERRAALAPDDPAVRWAGGQLSYRELDRRANQLAHRLREHGVDAETRVGLYLPRSPELVVAMLAVLKAGGAFVPLDPRWPRLRIKAVATDAAVRVVCASGELAAPLEVPSVPVELAEPLEPSADTPPARRTDGDQLAYVIYTSGSTGTPKGAMIRQRSIANRVVWQAGLLDFGPGDAALFKAPLGFDISINEIFLPLSTGATLVVAAPGQERDVDALLRLIITERVSFCYLVSSMLAAMLELPDFAAASPRHVWCGGEPLTAELFARFRAATDATMYHGYGPAEATIGVTHEVYRPGSAREATTIGRANPNTVLHVLDEYLRPVPPGVLGELYVGGLLLGRGYVGDPRRTAERFVADPFAGTGARLYRTGDLVSWLPDGRLRFVGRADNQVKIRGMRVEPEEVSSVLAAHPSVTQAEVLTPADPSGRVRLVGFYAGDPAPDELDGWLRRRLAEHMVPALLVALPALPIQPSGKVDRAALAARIPAPRTTGEPARTPTERRLLAEFRAVLGREDAGTLDNFFDLGGHSMLATRLVVRLRATGYPDLAVRTLLGRPTVAELARHLDSADSADTADAADTADTDVLVALRTSGSGPPLFCVHPVSGLADAYAGLLAGLPDRPVYGLRAHSLLGDTELPVDLEDMARRYVARIRQVQPDGPYHLLGWSLGGSVAHLMAAQLAAAGQRVATLALLDSVPARLLGDPERDAPLERYLAQLLRASGVPVERDEVSATGAAELLARDDAGLGGGGGAGCRGGGAGLGGGGLSGYTAGELLEVARSWRHSAGLRAGTDPVHHGDLLLFQAAREPGASDLAALWRDRVSGTVHSWRIAATHWGMAAPDVLDQVAVQLR